jgi:single-stranded-DNA-specific exonuclease
MGKTWLVRPRDDGRIEQLAHVANVPRVVAQLLLNRGIHEPDCVREFLAARLSNLRDPELLPGLSSAADQIHAAVSAGEKITIYGDYDADGMTGTSILLRCLRLMNADVDFYIPHRLHEGYGVNLAALEKLAARGTRWVITVDCGITSVAEVESAKAFGLRMIITDHHEFADSIPHAAAVIHPRLPGTDYPFAGLCGAGVAFKLAWALCQRATGAARVSERFKNFLISATGVAAIATVADVVPLVDENRLIVRHGLNALMKHPVPGIQALLDVTQLSRRTHLASEDIAFTIAPRLNAAGRLGQADLGVELLATDSTERAADLAKYLNELNENRTSIERSIYLAANKQIKERFDAENDPALVLAQRGWHSGVIGIVAGRLAEKYSRPVVMIALDELGKRLGVGSARSALGVDLHGALCGCADHLETFGGHAAAAGLKIDEAHVDRFRDHFCQEVAQRVPEDGRTAELHIDAESPLVQLTLRTVGQIEQLAPFGEGNPRPLLCANRVTLDGPPRKMGAGDRHLALGLSQQGVSLRAVAFGQGEWAEPLQAADGPIDVAYRPVINHFRGRRTVELHLEDWRPSQVAAPVR